MKMHFKVSRQFKKKIVLLILPKEFDVSYSDQYGYVYVQSCTFIYPYTIRNYSKSSYDHPSPNLEIRFTWSVSPVQYLGARDRRQGHCAIKCQK